MAEAFSIMFDSLKVAPVLKTSYIEFAPLETSAETIEQELRPAV